jgi:hypothetical protein
MLKWKYGNYQFAINPDTQGSNIQLVGDVARTLTGALISQPSFLQESYDISSVFYQGRSKSLSQISLSNASFVDYYNNQCYVLNKTNDRIDIYNSSYGYISTVSLSAIPNKSYMAFDVVSDGYWVICDNGSYDSIYKISLSGSLLVNNTNAIAKTVQAVGVELMSGYLWVLRGTGKIDQVRITDFSVTTSAIVLQFGINYAGITSDGTYLIVGSNDNYTKLYHVDTVNNVAINQITFDNILTITDLAYDGSKYYILNSSNQLQSISGNTVDIDVYRLRNEIQNYKYVNLVDDMGITTRVFASNFSSNRKDGYEHMYDISMTINKIDRG